MTKNTMAALAGVGNNRLRCSKRSGRYLHGAIDRVHSPDWYLSFGCLEDLLDQQEFERGGASKDQ